MEVNDAGPDEVVVDEEVDDDDGLFCKGNY